MYHILVELKNKKYYEEYDLEKSEKEIINDYIVPYLKNEDFFIGSNFVKKEDIIEFVIKKTEIRIENYRQQLEWKRNSSGVVYLYPVYKRVTLRNQITGKNIVGDLIKQAKEKEELLKEKEIDGTSISRSDNRVFIVHGHDNEMKIDVARFIDKIGLESIILHEQASKGQTIIDKIDEYTNVSYGIVLYSPCDLGKAKNDTELKERARQNVVFEHGYLIGKLGKNKVIALNKGDIETPSDIGGVVYIPYNTHEGWKISIIKELKENNFEIDYNKIF